LENEDKNFAISENRIDIIVGIEYVKAYINQYKTDFFKRLYIANKRAFNGLREKNWNHNWKNGKQKRGKFAFIQCFNLLIDSIKETGINTDKVPVYIGDKNELWVSDGMHRVATCYGLGIKADVTIHNQPIEEHSRWYYPTNIEFFRKRGMRDVYCDYTMEVFFRKYFKDFSCLIFQSAETDFAIPDEISSLYRDSVLYEHKINFDSNDDSLFAANIKNILSKETQHSFKNYSNLKIVFLKGDNKEEFEEMCNNVKSNDDINLCYISNDAEECKTILQLLNKNTIQFLDEVDINSGDKRFIKVFEELKTFCLEHKLDTNKICIVGDFVKSLYNETDCNDLKLVVDKSYWDIFNNSQFDIGNECITTHTDDVLYNPNNYFYYHNFKCGLTKFIKGE
jgi:hypothetical protein